MYQNSQVLPFNGRTCTTILGEHETTYISYDLYRWGRSQQRWRQIATTKWGSGSSEASCAPTSFKIHPALKWGSCGVLGNTLLPANAANTWRSLAEGISRNPSDRILRILRSEFDHPVFGFKSWLRCSTFCQNFSGFFAIKGESWIGRENFIRQIAMIPAFRQFSQHWLVV